MSSNSSEDNIEIDDSLYSRQRYVLGDAAMKRILASNVLISGFGALGVEIAKNVCLAGVKAMTVHDTKEATSVDLSGQFFIGEEDLGKNRAEVSTPKLAELNPHVNISSSTVDLLDDLSMLDQFKVVVLTEANKDTQDKVGEYCHANGICFIIADVFGVFFQAFVDFGDKFEVVDKNGERERVFMISEITNEENATVTTLDEALHGLEDNDVVVFDEIEGMEGVAGPEFKVTVVNPYSFTIGDTTQYTGTAVRGICKQKKVPFEMSFKPLAESSAEPEIVLADFAKFMEPYQMHVAFQALHAFRAKHDGALPAPWDQSEADEFMAIANELKGDVELNDQYIRNLALTAQGVFPPLAAFAGGFIGQETLKAVTGKYTPLNQWLYVDCVEVLPEPEDAKNETFAKTGDRYDAVRLCIGDGLLAKIRDCRLFMVGSGAIGCEMLKNYAMVGLGCGDEGMVTLTDNDIIEKSNLNRQFLFRNHDIQQPKSETAANAVQAMNPDIKVDPHLEKVGPDTEDRYSDEFFQSLNLVCNALDNIQARLYMDGRAVVNRIPLLESGTLGTKGHVQVVVPYKTESYGSQRDPPEEDYPMCTLKSFPSKIEHTIQFFRSKFQSLLANKPVDVNTFLQKDNFYEEFQNLGDDQLLEVRNIYLYLVERKLTSYEECVQFARIKFEKYFKNKIIQLLHNYPLDMVTKDGSPFWKLPKRPPQPMEFDADNQMHMDFITSLAKIMARIYKLESHDDMDKVRAALEATEIPEFIPVDGKHIETDEKAKEEDVKEKEEPKSKLESIDREKFDAALKELAARKANGEDILLEPEDFEKDDDSNGHIDFITAGSNLRATQYGVETADRVTTKGIAGKIIPAIATTTSAVAGLVTIEMIKLLKGCELEAFKNTFMNLALPVFQMSEPGAAPSRKINDKVSITMWDRWDVSIGDCKLQELIDHFLNDYNLEVTGVFNGVKTVYNSVLPMHKKRLGKAMSKLIKGNDGNYTDLTVTFVEPGTNEEVDGAPVRFFF
eukprot:TRINITY_DN4238_c0_g1_i1.p1 TRINITY_DN4238_c0_g1~~TRINITY_DN4238_c0_g1_i1.p1  ORF type:complete len:1011 (-),score=457.88 TRINITY_DN4238_c0_g1_i1:44-3076(-)